MNRHRILDKKMGRPKQFDRDEALKLATELFRRKGFASTSIDDLVHELQINRASLYETFGDKRELFDEALSHYSQNAIQFVTNFFSEDTGSIREKFIDFFLKAIETMRSGSAMSGCFVANCTAELLPSDKNVAAFLAGHRDRIEQIFSAALRKAIETGEIKSAKDTQALAKFLYTFHNGLSLQAKLPGKKSFLMDSAKQALHAVFD